MTSTTPPEIASHAEALIPQFQFERLLNQDQAGRRISLLGTINSLPAILLIERAAFPTDTPHLISLPASLTNIKNLGANDIYNWFLASSPSTSSTPDLKLNLIYPCVAQHIKKYSSQGLRIVTETPEIYAKYIRPFMQAKREKGALNWIFNILEGRTEQEDVIYRTTDPEPDEGFLLLPDLNWDRKTISGLHLLGIVERRDIWSVRDLKKMNVGWLKHMRDMLLEATVKLYPELERDQLKLYVHCKSNLARYPS
jgi:m7GpppX diphosphatase